MVWRQRTLLIAIALFKLLSASRALAYPTPVDFDGHLLRWQKTLNDPIIYYEFISEDNENSAIYQRLAVRSAEIWNEVDGCFLKLHESAGETPQISLTIRKRKAGENLLSGFTVFDEKTPEGWPSHCSIDILADDNEGMIAVAKTILHEMGHCFGLGHSLIAESIMSYNNQKNQFALDLDDRAAVSRLYPKNGTSELPPGCATIGMTKTRPELLWFLVLLPLLFIFLLGRLPLTLDKKRAGPVLLRSCLSERNSSFSLAANSKPFQEKSLLEIEQPNQLE